jgi:hypothetical protein
MLRLLNHDVSNYFANMGSIHICNHLTNQAINDIWMGSNSPLFQCSAEKLLEALGLRIVKNLIRRTIFLNHSLV